LVNPGLVNAYSCRVFSRQKARLSAFSPENLRFKNPVKYNHMTKINFTDAATATPPDPLLPKYFNKNKVI
jgi:hypothetical protein